MASVEQQDLAEKYQLPIEQVVELSKSFNNDPNAAGGNFEEFVSGRSKQSHELANKTGLDPERIFKLSKEFNVNPEASGGNFQNFVQSTAEKEGATPGEPGGGFQGPAEDFGEFKPTPPADGDAFTPPGEGDIGIPRTPGIDPTQGNIDVSGRTGKDVSRILEEAERAKTSQENLLGEQAGLRSENRRELAETLNTQLDRQFNEATPGILEELNTRGLARSSEVGDRFAKERGRLGAGVTEQLALQGLKDSEKQVSGLSGIQDQFLQSRQGAVSRRFSLEDFARQVEAGKAVGQATAPVTPFSGSGKSGTTQAALGGAGLGLAAKSG